MFEPISQKDEEKTHQLAENIKSLNSANSHTHLNSSTLDINIEIKALKGQSDSKISEEEVKQSATQSAQQKTSHARESEKQLYEISALDSIIESKIKGIFALQLDKIEALHTEAYNKNQSALILRIEELESKLENHIFGIEAKLTEIKLTNSIILKNTDLEAKIITSQDKRELVDKSKTEAFVTHSQINTSDQTHSESLKQVDQNLSLMDEESKNVPICSNCQTRPIEVTLACNHSCCRPCWKNYESEALRLGHRKLKCFYSHCTAPPHILPSSEDTADPHQKNCTKCHEKDRKQLYCGHSLCFNCDNAYLNTRPLKCQACTNVRKPLQIREEQRLKADDSSTCRKCREGSYIPRSQTSMICNHCKSKLCLVCHNQFENTHTCPGQPQASDTKTTSSIEPPAKIEYHCECKRSGRTVELNCRHSVCAVCFQNHVLKQVVVHGLSYQSISCPECQAVISEIILLKQVFLGENEFYAKIEAALTAQQSAPVFSCMLCFSSLKVEDGITLDCEHRFCRGCFTEYITQLVRSNRVDAASITCPSYNCKAEISDFLLENCLEEADFEKLNHFRLQKEFTKCPSGRCSYIGLNDTDDTFFCGECQNAYCLNCSQIRTNDHICRLVDSDKLGKESQELSDLGVKPCPKCKEALMKDAGCNFARCPSSICLGRTFFCWLCEQLLTLEDHYSHFPDGPFGSKCTGEKLILQQIEPTPLAQLCTVFCPRCHDSKVSQTLQVGETFFKCYICFNTFCTSCFEDFSEHHYCGNVIDFKCCNCSNSFKKNGLKYAECYECSIYTCIHCAHPLSISDLNGHFPKELGTCIGIETPPIDQVSFRTEKQKTDFKCDCKCIDLFEICNCGNSPCRNCFKAYLLGLGKFNLDDVICFNCSRPVPRERVTALFEGEESPRTQMKLTSEMQTVKCPDCPYSTEQPNTQDTLSCLKCNKVYCLRCKELSHKGHHCDIKLTPQETPVCLDNTVRSDYFILTKLCPYCNRKVEKFGESKLQYCQNTNCGRCFCWLCGDLVTESQRLEHFCEGFHCTELIQKNAPDEVKRPKEEQLPEPERCNCEIKSEFKLVCGHKVCPECFLTHYTKTPTARMKCPQCIDVVNQITLDRMKDLKKQSQLKQDSKRASFVETTTKNCPSCRTPCSNEANTLEVSCTKCKKAFCWNCRNSLTFSNRSTHFTGPSKRCRNIR